METCLTTCISSVADTLRSGDLAAVPTETVYGLAADGRNAAAVKKLYEVKGRPPQKPISLLVPGWEACKALSDDLTESARILADAFWPGPLTIVVKKSRAVPDIVTAGRNTVGLRCPDHPLTLKLLREFGGPLAAPSANLSGMPSPKSAHEVLKALGGRIPFILDGGTCSVGIESTIVDLTGPVPRILRRGGLAPEEIAHILGTEVIA
ncbi:MAG: threonylcarbamoyl-AMP synthase [Oscillospiraceae bacterium]|nr:threonylcarbamoyl-AMP synthase [Oscillospiraceae bacterium]